MASFGKERGTYFFYVLSAIVTDIMGAKQIRNMGTFNRSVLETVTPAAAITSDRYVDPSKFYRYIHYLSSKLVQ